VGRSIVLHLLARTKFISSGTTFLLILPQIQVSDDPGQGAVREAPAVFAFEDFLNPDHIALGAAEDLPEEGRNLRVGGLPLRSLRPLSPDDPADRDPREFKDLADLPDGHSPLIKTPNGLLTLLGDHRSHTSRGRV